ncbi:hypothetical protein EAO68_02535 [Streptomyces sp. wa22]|nr:hypothetical protein EAO68_02535 [Streptomyces sp. wa22]WSQ85821.1 hypothetical protein OG722_16245 [Streptomyces sp. NBC_01212]
MKTWAQSGAVAGPVEITSASVRCGDVIQVGGCPCRVVDLIQLTGGAKRLRFASGESLTMHARSQFVALRVMRHG